MFKNKTLIKILLIKILLLRSDDFLEIKYHKFPFLFKYRINKKDVIYLIKYLIKLKY